jgi:hypothetical protein
MHEVLYKKNTKTLLTVGATIWYNPEPLALIRLSARQKKLKRIKAMNRESYIVQTARGAQADTAEVKWWDADWCATLDQAREAVEGMLYQKMEVEDRGDEYVDAWQELADQALDTDVGDVLAFDEFAVRIRKEVA